MGCLGAVRKELRGLMKRTLGVLRADCWGVDRGTLGAGREEPHEPYVGNVKRPYGGFDWAWGSPGSFRWDLNGLEGGTYMA